MADLLLPTPGPRREGPARQHRLLALRISLSVLFGAVALRGVGTTAVLDEFRNADPAWLAGVAPLLVLSYLIGAVRWRLLLRCQRIELGFADAVRYCWIGLFFANVLPSGFGGDAARAWIAGRRTGGVAAVTASVLADRLTAVWALMGLGAGAALAGGGSLPREVVVTLILSCLAVLVGSVVLLAAGPARVLAQLLARWPRAARAIGGVSQGMAVYRGRGRQLTSAVGLSLLAQACVVLAAWMLARSLGLDISVWLVATTIPVALLATAAPTSVNGFGVREAAFRALLVPAGVTAAQAVAFSLATVVAGTLVSLPGAIAWIGVDRRTVVAGPAVPPA